jgi:hypothetical protein
MLLLCIGHHLRTIMGERKPQPDQDKNAAKAAI